MVEDRIPVEASSAAAVREATATPMTSYPASSQPTRAAPEHGRLARPGLADDHLEAVARAEEHLHSEALLEVEMGMGVERPGHPFGAHLARAGTDAALGGLGDAALDAQHLHGRVPAVAEARGRRGSLVWFAPAPYQRPGR